MASVPYDWFSAAVPPVATGGNHTTSILTVSYAVLLIQPCTRYGPDTQQLQFSASFHNSAQVTLFIEEPQRGSTVSQ